MHRTALTAPVTAPAVRSQIFQPGRLLGPPLTNCRLRPQALPAQQSAPRAAAAPLPCKCVRRQIRGQHTLRAVRTLGCQQSGRPAQQVAAGCSGRAGTQAHKLCSTLADRRAAGAQAPQTAVESPEAKAVLPSPAANDQVRPALHSSAAGHAPGPSCSPAGPCGAGRAEKRSWVWPGQLQEPCPDARACTCRLGTRPRLRRSARRGRRPTLSPASCGWRRPSRSAWTRCSLRCASAARVLAGSPQPGARRAQARRRARGVR